MGPLMVKKTHFDWWRCPHVRQAKFGVCGATVVPLLFLTAHLTSRAWFI